MKDNWHSNTDPISNAGNSFATGAENLARGAAHGIGSLIAHPLDAVQSIGESAVAGGITPYGVPIYSMTGNQKIDQQNRDNVRLARVDMANQGANAAKNPAYTAGGVIGPALLAHTIGGAPGGVDALQEAFPTRARAGKLLDEVKAAAGDQPVSLVRTLPAIEEAQRLSMWGHGNITPLDSLYQRMNTANPVQFEEARGRYSPLTRLTSSDKMRATPQLQAAAKSVAHAMREDIGDTARSVGKGDEYEKGMSQYARASRNREMIAKTLKYGAQAGAGAAGAGAAYKLVHALKN